MYEIDSMERSRIERKIGEEFIRSCEEYLGKEKFAFLLANWGIEAMVGSFVHVGVFQFMRFKDD